MVDKSGQTIQLDQFMKLVGMVSTGGQAKVVIQSGQVQVNGIIETRRKKKLSPGDRVTFQGRTEVVRLPGSSPGVETPG